MLRLSVRRYLLPAAGALAIAAALAGSAVAGAPSAVDTASALGPKPYSIAVDKVTAKAGQQATAQVKILPGPNYHLNLDYPLSLKLTLPAGVTAPKSTFAKSDAKSWTEKGGQLDVVLVGSAAGPKTVQGQLKFAVCTATTCEPQTSPVTIELTVQ